MSFFVLMHDAYNTDEFVDFYILSQYFSPASNLKDLLQLRNIHPKRIIYFLHAIGLTNKL